MTDRTEKTSDLMPISEAAKRLGLGREYARDLAIRCGVAIRRGGSDDHPWLRVRLSALEQAFMNQVYRPSPHRVKTAARPIGLNPLVKC